MTMRTEPSYSEQRSRLLLILDLLEIVREITPAGATPSSVARRMDTEQMAQCVAATGRPARVPSELTWGLLCDALDARDAA